MHRAAGGGRQFFLGVALYEDRLTVCARDETAVGLPFGYEKQFARGRSGRRAMAAEAKG